MKRILVVDDDSQIRKGIGEMMTREVEACECVLASNGLEALDTMKQTDIDVLITDVSMPVMSGAELLESMRKEGMEIPVIMISGFNDYQYIRSGMRFGALDYILKPIDHDELMEMVSKALEIKGKRRNLEGWQLRSSLYDYLVSQRETPRRELSEEMLRLHLERQTPVLPVLVGVRGDRKEETAAELCALLREAGCTLALSQIHGQRIGLLLFGIDPFQADGVLAAFARKNRGMRYAALSSPCSLERLPEGMEECEGLLERSWFDGKISADGAFSPEEMMKMATEAFEKLDSEEAIRWLNACMDQMAGQNNGRSFITKALIKWHIDLMGCVKELVALAGEYTFTSMDFALAIQNADSFTQMKEKAAEIIRGYCREIAAQRDRRGGQIESIKRYIAEHLSESLKITEIAEMVNLHPNYLSTLFKKYECISYRDYVRKVRIETAIRMVSETNLKIYEVAERVGYPDPAHFSRAFKQVTGVSPQQFFK